MDERIPTSRTELVIRRVAGRAEVEVFTEAGITDLCFATGRVRAVGEGGTHHSTPGVTLVSHLGLVVVAVAHAGAVSGGSIVGTAS